METWRRTECSAGLLLLLALVCCSIIPATSIRRIRLEHHKVVGQQQITSMDVLEIGRPSRSMTTRVLTFMDPYDAGPMYHPVAKVPSKGSQIVSFYTIPTGAGQRSGYIAVVLVSGVQPPDSITFTIEGSDGYVSTVTACTVSDIAFPGGQGKCEVLVPPPVEDGTDTVTVTVTRDGIPTAMQSARVQT